MKSVNPSVLHKLLSYPLSLVLTPVGGLFTIFMSAVALTLAFLTGSAKKAGDWSLQAWAKAMCFIFRIDLVVEGEENLPEEGCLFLFNHNSLFDIVIFHAGVLKSARFGAKIELFSIPIFGQCMTRMGALPIARGDIEKVKAVYEKSIPKVKEGKSYILAAEGTRNDEPGVGKNLKSGPMIFSLSGQFPIVPIVMIGAYEIVPKTSLLISWGRFRNPVKLKILPPVPTQGLGLEDRHRLKEEIRQKMTNAFQEG